MVGLLDLPAEILDTIVELVLYAETSSPDSIEAARTGRLPGRNGNFDTAAWSYGPRHVLYSDASRRSNAAGLLRVNQSLHRQTWQAISRLFPEGPGYKLDVMLVDEQELWPTWTHVPYLAEKVDRVEVTYRVFGARRTGYSAFVNGDGSAHQIVWCHYFLLENFLHYGPYLSTENDRLVPGQKHYVTVRSVTMQFEAGDKASVFQVDDMDCLSVWHTSQRCKILAGENRLAIHPNWLAKDVSTDLSFLCEMRYHAAAWGMVLYERVGSFHLLQPEPHHLYLHKTLGKLYASPAGDGAMTSPEHEATRIYTKYTMGHLRGDCRVLSFWNWKFSTIKTRREFGLDVPSDPRWPTLEEWMKWRKASEAARAEKLANGESWGCNGKGCLCYETGLEEFLKAREQA